MEIQLWHLYNSFFSPNNLISFLKRSQYASWVLNCAIFEPECQYECHFSACYSYHAILCNAHWSILPFHTRLQVSELLSSGDVAVCQNGAGKVRLFIPASSNTFTLYFFLISSLVKLKEVFPPVSAAVTMAFKSMLDFNRSKHCLSDTSFPKRVSDSPALMCRLPTGSSGSLSIGPLCDLSRNITRAHGSLSYCLDIENLTRKCHTSLQELNLVAVWYFSYYDSKERDITPEKPHWRYGDLQVLTRFFCAPQ